LNGLVLHDCCKVLNGISCQICYALSLGKPRRDIEEMFAFCDELYSYSLAELEKMAKPSTIFASNTSELSISSLASSTHRPKQFIGTHWFFPPQVMKLIEIVRGMETSEETFQTAKELCVKLGKTPIEAEDAPGFISSRLIFNYMNEGIYALYEGLGTKEEIDSIMKMGANHPMGPIELADLVGLDTVLSVMNVLKEAFGDKYHPCPLLVKYVNAGHLGVKTGRGFYPYGEKK
jgi:3-hydroxybutyryl-CoA dehydrogenase